MITISDATRAFIARHEDDDVDGLALHARRDGDVDLPFALDQIAGRRRARAKLPRWAATDGIVYPPHLPMEQCSGEFASAYKARLAARLLDGTPRDGRTLVDMTGGFGVDFVALAPLFARATYVERQEALCDVARRNLPLLGLPDARIVHGDGLEVLREAPDDAFTMVYADPARRDEHGSRTYAIGDCTPDVLRARDLILARAPLAMVKLSPMLDWRRTAEEFAGAVREVHIVAAGNECKELLLVLGRGTTPSPHVYAVNDGRGIDFVPGEGSGTDGARADAASDGGADGLEGAWLGEPNAAVMKAGCFDLLESRYGVRAIARNSHLFVARDPRPDFPGRGFTVERVSTMNRKELRRALAGVTRANVAVRNFPLTAPALRRRLGLADGGDVYVFATTDAAGRHVVLVTRKAGAPARDAD